VISSEYQKTLVDNINLVSDTGRPVLVFFKTRADMINLYKSPYLRQHLQKCFYVSEDDDEHLRDNRIQMAGNRGTVTLLTEKFSRGTDFILEDKILIDAGGFHVIQTYVSKDESDYVQVCGRTARQGKKGSYQMVINREILTSLNINNFD
jgi:preprotein translocase subunit SecA